MGEDNSSLMAASVGKMPRSPVHRLQKENQSRLLPPTWPVASVTQNAAVLEFPDVVSFSGLWFCPDCWLMSLLREVCFWNRRENITEPSGSSAPKDNVASDIVYMVVGVSRTVVPNPRVSDWCQSGAC